MAAVRHFEFNFLAFC